MWISHIALDNETLADIGGEGNVLNRIFMFYEVLGEIE